MKVLIDAMRTINNRASRGTGATTALLAGKSGYAVVVNYLSHKQGAKVCFTGIFSGTLIRSTMDEQLDVLLGSNRIAGEVRGFEPAKSDYNYFKR